MSLSKAKKKLDTVFSQFIRLRGSNEEGYGNCFTCDRLKHWKEVHCGHFITRAKLSTRWMETNCQFQCAKCNLFAQGEQYIFGRKLDEFHGEGTAESIQIASNQTRKFSVHELEEMYQYYKKRVDEIKESRGMG